MTEVNLDALRAAIAGPVRELTDRASHVSGSVPHRSDPGLRRSGPAAVVVPVRIANDADLASLVRMLLAIAAAPTLRAQALAGVLRIDARVAPASASPGAAIGLQMPVREPAVQASLTDKVITEALLRTRAKPGQSISIPPNAILTASAQDYARSNRIALCRGVR
ncbi:MAG: hypothetical protein AB7L76_15460 [Burkholderiaceae bacterium]